MLSLNDTICNIIKTDNLNISLSEDNGNEIANILIRNKINYNLIDIKDQKSDGNYLILSQEDNKLEKAYDHLGKIILKFKKNFIKQSILQLLIICSCHYALMLFLSSRRMICFISFMLII